MLEQLTDGNMGALYDMTSENFTVISCWKAKDTQTSIDE